MDRREVGGIGAAEESVVYPAGAGECEVIAACNECTMQSLQASAAGADGVFANLSAFRLVGKLGSWEVGKLAGRW